MLKLTTLILIIAFIAIFSVEGVPTIGNKIIYPSFSEGLVPLTFQNKETAYFLSTFAANAGVADWYCRQSYRRLLSIVNATEQDEIEEFLKSNKDVVCVWTSGTDIAKEGTWLWGNNISIVYENFKPRQREDHTKNCLRLLGYNYVNRYKWMKESCDKEFHFICEFEW